jgi:hypothetical protein
MIAIADAREPRWFFPTPGRLLVVLLTVEGFLWLSEWLQWTSKGWPVLIAVAAVGAFLLVMLGWFVLALLFHWRFQFSILSLLVLTVAVALPCGWLATEMKQATKQREVVEGIGQVHGWVCYDFQVDPSGCWTPDATPAAPTWLRDLLGDDLFLDVIWVTLKSSEVTDAGLEHLKGLAKLQRLSVSYTKVSDAGLEHLKGLTHLRLLDLWGTKVTDAGVKRLQQALPNCKIYYLP